MPRGLSSSQSGFTRRRATQARWLCRKSGWTRKDSAYHDHHPLGETPNGHKFNLRYRLRSSGSCIVDGADDATVDRRDLSQVSRGNDADGPDTFCAMWRGRTVQGFVIDIQRPTIEWRCCVANEKITNGERLCPRWEQDVQADGRFFVNALAHFPTFMPVFRVRPVAGHP